MANQRSRGKSEYGDCRRRNPRSPTSSRRIPTSWGTKKGGSDSSGRKKSKSDRPSFRNRRKKSCRYQHQLTSSGITSPQTTRPDIKRVSASPGNPRFPPQARPRYTKPRPSSDQPVGSPQGIFATTSVPTNWKSAVVLPLPNNYGVAHGRMPTETWARSSGSRDLPGPAVPVSATEASRQSQRGHHSPSGPPTNSSMSDRCVEAAGNIPVLANYYPCPRAVAKESSPPQSTARLPILRQLDTSPWVGPCPFLLSFSCAEVSVYLWFEVFVLGACRGRGRG
jgi:hypothetical protein